jgi:predicted dehydrogenase
LKNKASKNLIYVAIVGSGIIGKTLADAFTRDPKGRYKITAICDTDLARAEDLARIYNADVYQSHNEIVAREDISLVYIAVPPKYHYQIFLDSISENKHVLCEKPLCLSNKEAKQMSHFAHEVAALGVVTAVNFPMQYVKAVQQFKNILQLGNIGQLNCMKLQIHLSSWPRSWQNYSKTDWINTRDQGGPLREIGCHLLFAALMIIAKFDTVDQVNAKIFPDNDEFSETGISGIILLKSGKYINIDIMANTYLVKDEIKLIAYGENGIICLDDFQNLLISLKGKPLQYYEPESIYKADELMSSDPLVDNLAKAILESPNSPESWNLANISIGEMVTKIVNACFDSKGNWVKINS